MSHARPVAARSSIAWTFDETRATMQELRRQLQIEKEVSRDAERGRDELARELNWYARGAGCAERGAAGARGAARRGGGGASSAEEPRDARRRH